MINDPIVEEVRRVRQQLFEKCGNDLHRYFEFIRASREQHGDRLITSLEELRARRKSAAAVVPPTSRIKLSGKA